MPASDPDGLEMSPDVYRGTRIRETVPATLDLADNAGLAVHGIFSTIDPDVLHTMCRGAASCSTSSWPSAAGCRACARRISPTLPP